MTRRAYFPEPRYSRDPARVQGDVCYLIHFDTPYRHARHYLGTTSRLTSRLHEHQTGAGARLMEVVTGAGISWRLARLWRGGRRIERELKNKKRAPALCPICNPRAPRRVPR
jgi:predicted GIY-YIG superfamily endonuclease